MLFNAHFSRCYQGNTNFGRQFARENNIFTLALNIRGSSVWELLDIKYIAPRILKWPKI